MLKYLPVTCTLAYYSTVSIIVRTLITEVQLSSYIIMLLIYVWPQGTLVQLLLIHSTILATILAAYLAPWHSIKMVFEGS
jgi:hypothetical protein